MKASFKINAASIVWFMNKQQCLFFYLERSAEVQPVLFDSQTNGIN